MVDASLISHSKLHFVTSAELAKVKRDDFD